MWLSIIIPILLSILVIVCILLTLVVLMQRPKNEGLGAAFGSSMTENIFGAQTATVLTKATVYLGCIFFGVTLLLTVLTARQSAERRVGVLESEVRKAAISPTPKTAAPTASVSPQASASAAPSAAPAASVPPAASATPATSVSPQSSPSASPSPSVAASPSPTSASDASPAPSASVEQASPPPSASPQQ